MRICEFFGKIKGFPFPGLTPPEGIIFLWKNSEELIPRNCTEFCTVRDKLLHTKFRTFNRFLHETTVNGALKPLMIDILAPGILIWDRNNSVSDKFWPKEKISDSAEIIPSIILALAPQTIAAVFLHLRKAVTMPHTALYGTKTTV